MASAHQSQSQRQPKKRVEFSSLEIIELPYGIGDNPSVSCGCPISTSWETQKRTTLDLKFFEEFRPKRRDKKALHLSKVARHQLLLTNGFSERDIKLATMQASKVRQERLETIEELRQRVKEITMATVIDNSGTSCYKNTPKGNRRYVSKHLMQQSLKIPLSPSPNIRSKSQPALTSTPPPMHNHHRRSQVTNTPMSVLSSQSPNLAPSPITSKRSPQRVSPPGRRLPYLSFPSTPENGVLSPRFATRHHGATDNINTNWGIDACRNDSRNVRGSHNQLSKRRPVDLGGSLFSTMAKDERFLSHTSKRVCSPRTKDVLRVPVRVKSPMMDKVLVPPRRLASPQPSRSSHSAFLFHQQQQQASTPPRAI